AGRMDVDIVVLRGTGQWPDCRTTRLFDEHLIVVGAASVLPEGRHLTEAEFAEFRLLQNISRPSLWMQWLGSANIVRQGPIAGPRFAITDTLISAATEGIGLAVVPEYLVHGELRTGLLRKAFAQTVGSGEQIYVCRPEARVHRPQAGKFMRWLSRRASRQP